MACSIWLGMFQLLDNCSDGWLRLNWAHKQDWCISLSLKCGPCTGADQPAAGHGVTAWACTLRLGLVCGLTW